MMRERTRKACSHFCLEDDDLSAGSCQPSGEEEHIDSETEKLETLINKGVPMRALVPGDFVGDPRMQETPSGAEELDAHGSKPLIAVLGWKELADLMRSLKMTPQEVRTALAAVNNAGLSGRPNSAMILQLLECLPGAFARKAKINVELLHAASTEPTKAAALPFTEILSYKHKIEQFVRGK